MLLSDKNTKLGRVTNFSLPLSSCNKKYTKECRKYCYAKFMFRLYPKYKNKMDLNLKSSKKDDFIAKVCYELAEATIPIRIHVSGDFYSQEYLNKWIMIAKLNKEHLFYCYTKNLDLDYSRRPDNFIVYLSDDMLRLKKYYGKFDGVTAISFDKQDIKGFELCSHQSEEKLTCSRCRKCMEKGHKIFFYVH